jgi:hypothetical protein
MRFVLAFLGALGVAACGAPEGDVDPSQDAAPVVSSALVEVTPTLRLEGVGRQVGSVVVEELFLHVSEVRLAPADSRLTDASSTPMWAHYTRDSELEINGLEPILVRPGEYSVGLTLSPSAAHATRTPGALNTAALVARGVCLLFDISDGDATPGRAYDDGRSNNNPVPMPARPTAKPTIGKIVRVPFVLSLDSVMSVTLRETVSLNADGIEVAVTLDVGRWMEEAVHPIVAEIAAQTELKAGAAVDLRLSAEEGDPRAEAFREALEASVAGALSARLNE